MQIELIKQQIAQQMDCAFIEITGDGQHFQALVVSDAFIGKTRVQQQQMVYACLQSWITSGALHALSLKTLTVADWQANG